MHGYNLIYLFSDTKLPNPPRINPVKAIIEKNPADAAIVIQENGSERRR